MAGINRNPMSGYRAYLPNSMDYLHDDQAEKKGFGYIGFYKWALALTKTNQRAAKCIECGAKIKAGAGIYHLQYQRSGYLHLECTRKMIEKYGAQYGYGETMMFNLGAYTYKHEYFFTAQQVADSIRLFDAEAAQSLAPIAIELDALPIALAVSVRGN